MDNSERPQSPVAVITGATAGIGRATALTFAERGYRVGIIARGKDGLDGARVEIERGGGEVLVLPADVADPDAVEAAAARVEAEWGGIDVWINDAMATVFSDIASLAPKELRRVTDVTYHGAVWGTLAALKRMRRCNRGSIVQVGSVLAYRSIPLQSAYCGAKSALRAFTDSLRAELIHEKSAVRVTMVHLPAVNTPQFDLARSNMNQRPAPLGKIYQPEVPARAIVWAARHRRRELWVGSGTVEAILGTRFFPGLLDQMLARDAYDEQLGEPIVPRPGNLFEPVAGDHGSLGRFDAKAASHSPQLWLDRHRNAVAVGIALLAAAAAVAAVAAVAARRR